MNTDSLVKDFLADTLAGEPLSFHAEKANIRFSSGEQGYVLQMLKSPTC